MEFRETSQIELKSELNDSVKKEILAFANTNGGKIYIGVDDHGNVIGLKNAQQDLESISNMIRDSIRPDISMHTSATIIEAEQKEIIVIEVSKGTKRPYHLSSKGLRPSGVFVRHGITSSPASEEAIRQMIIDSDGNTFEKTRCLKQDLSFEYAKNVFQEKGLPFKEAQYRTLGMADEDGYFTNLGLLLSDQCEHSIKCAIYQGTSKLEFRDRKEFHGSILKQLAEAYEYINLQNKVESTFEGLSRVEIPDYPYFAIRESLINAVVHRDYSFGGSILVHVFEDRIEIVSIGGLVLGLTQKDIFLGVSESRNRNLANCFYRLKLIESYGTGIQRIKESYRSFRVDPEFHISDNAFVVVLPNTRYKKDLKSNEEKVLEIIGRKERVARRELEKELGLSKSSVTIILNKLLDEGFIVQKGNARNTVYQLVKGSF
ncbi:RNA-binding domain-containing protein [Heliorestis convoluta]|uniref:AAA family ATPase n=1 Tax=Heliorestis convoluta TaxID=356322 RepID=A0A5Q2N0E9_9FIRM|nr:RNA-binding domain-containing protein [Heliorestis convoluta]QGG47223.1 AAA family ATPase [Heliorestis convoluta]